MKYHFFIHSGCSKQQRSSWAAGLKGFLAKNNVSLTQSAELSIATAWLRIKFGLFKGGWGCTGFITRDKPRALLQQSAGRSMFYLDYSVFITVESLNCNWKVKFDKSPNPAPHETPLSTSTHEFHLPFLRAPLWFWTSTSVGPCKIKFCSECLRCCTSVGQRFDNVFNGLRLSGVTREGARPHLTSSVSTAGRLFKCRYLSWVQCLFLSRQLGRTYVFP